MASKTGGLLQDQNLNIRFNEASLGWKTDVSKAPSKRGAALAGRTPLGAKTDVSKAPSGRGAALAGRTPLGAKTDVSKAPSKRGAALAGRTPLGDLSNSLKPSMYRATRKQSSTLFSPLIEKEAVLKQQPAEIKPKMLTVENGRKRNGVEYVLFITIEAKFNRTKPNIETGGKYATAFSPSFFSLFPTSFQSSILPIEP